MFIEDYIKQRKDAPMIAGDPLEQEYRLQGWMAEGREMKVSVVHIKAGTVFVGSRAEAKEYITQQRTRQAIKTAERGVNPFFTR